MGLASFNRMRREQAEKAKEAKVSKPTKKVTPKKVAEKNKDK